MSAGQIPQKLLEILNVKERECALKSLEDVVDNSTEVSSTRNFCNATWDGLICWPKTEAGKLSSVACPDYVKLNPLYNATKYCTDSGQWFVNETTNHSFVNYSQCLNDSPNYRTALVTVGPYIENSPILKQWFPVVKAVSQIGYGVSLSTLIIAILIFSSIKKLRCARNRLHLHLFVSFSMRAFMALLKDTLFVEGVAMASDVVWVDGKVAYINERSSWVCKLITSLWEYFILANYVWIMMEGFYLHNLIFKSLCSDNTPITLYVCLGWGLPTIFVVSWVLGRIFFSDTYCWTTHENQFIFMLVRIPIIVSVLISFALFLNIVRVLFVKLNCSDYIQRRKVRYRRLVRSTLVLVPLFGVHYTMFVGMSYYVNVSPNVELAWLFCDQLFASFQGFFVAMLYCHLNGEVRAELSRKFNSWRYYVRTNQPPPPYPGIHARVTSRTSAPQLIILQDINKPE